MNKRMYAVRYELYIDDVLVDFKVNTYPFHYNDLVLEPVVTNQYNYNDIRYAIETFQGFSIQTKKFRTFIKVGDKWVNKKDIKTIKVVKTIEEYSKERLRNYSFHDLSKLLSFEEFRDYCIDNGLNVIKV